MDRNKISDELLREWLKHVDVDVHDDSFEERLASKLDAVDAIKPSHSWVRLLPGLCVLPVLILFRVQLWHGVLVLSRMVTETIVMFMADSRQMLLGAFVFGLSISCLVLLYPLLKKMI